MNMPTKSERLTTLIDQMEAIERFAHSFQAEGVWRSRPSSKKFKKFRGDYLNWFEQSSLLLDEYQRSLFRHYYSGFSNAIENYVHEPTATQTENILPYWKFPFESWFEKPFRQQQLLLQKARAIALTEESALISSDPPNSFHARVQESSSNLFRNGHYREAIFKACLALNEAVQQRSGRDDLDGTKLMQQVFSLSTPTLKFERHPDEQLGFMWLFSGVSMAVRNPRAHKTGDGEDLDANEALELLAMISALFRALDTATKVGA